MPNNVRICSKSELPGTDSANEFQAGDTMVCVANVGGEFHAMNNVCAHRGGPLGHGPILDGKVVCPLHGWMYNPKTGVPDENANLSVAVYRLRIEGDDVFVEL
jgi:nitrite reductase (NADH) small subunit